MEGSPPMRQALAQIVARLVPGTSVSGSLGYARLQGCGRGALDFVIRRKRVTLGRMGGGADCQMKTSSQKVGRKHALLEWDAKKKRWVISCLSKRGALVVDGVPVVPGAPPTILKSRALVEIGDTFFFFLLPRTPIAKTKNLSLIEKWIEEERVESRRRAEQRLKNAKRADENRRKLTLKIKAPRKHAKPQVQKKEVIDYTESKNSQHDQQQVASVPVIKDEYKKDWTKKEKADFLRAINAVGVEQQSSDKDGKPQFNWSKFRSVSPLPRKSDQFLAEYYLRWIADVEELLANEELEKRTKGPRTKHKAGCDCIVCENTRKSRRKLLEANGEESTEAANESTPTKPERLVGLVTAQKYKKRMAILEAAANVDSAAGKTVIAKLVAQPAGTGAGGELPIWWENGKHDRAMMIGCTRFGVGQWKTLWASDLFADVREDSSGEHVWPSEKTAMKRLREVANAINTLMRREQKRLKRKVEQEAQGIETKKRKSTPKKRRTQNKNSQETVVESRSEEAPGDEDEEDGIEENEGRRDFVEYYVEEIDESGAETEDEDESDAAIAEGETLEPTEDEMD